MAKAINASQPLKVGHLVAGEDLSAHQYKFVRQHTDDTIMAVSATTDIPLGVLQNKPLAGQPCTIVVIGVTEVIAGAANIVPPDTLTLKADGTVTEVGTGTVHVGRALETAVNGKLFTALVNCATARLVDAIV